MKSSPETQIKYYIRKEDRGFTLVEIVLVVALFAIVAGMLTVMDRSFIVRNDVELASETLTEALRRARILSTASSGDSVWGVHVGEGTVVIFKGDSFATRDPESDETFDLSSSVAVTGITDVVFEKVSGEPTVTGDMIVTSDTNFSSRVTVNEAGIILH